MVDTRSLSVWAVCSSVSVQCEQGFNGQVLVNAARQHE